MINLQPIEKSVNHSHLEVFDVWKTIQGEGPYAGRPAVFVRLSGCDLQCQLCDTDYTSKRNQKTPRELVGEIEKISKSSLVVFTGGEPYRQGALVSVVEMLWEKRRLVQIETNGTLYLQISPAIAATVVCSPKTSRIHPEMVKRVGLCRNDSYKYVVEADCVDLMDGLPLRVLGDLCRVARPPMNFPKSNIYIQPCDVQDLVKNKANMDQAIKVCMEFGYTLSLQMHKIAGLA